MPILSKNIKSAFGTPVQGLRNGACKNYAESYVNFTQWHSSCYRNSYMSKVK